MKKYTLLFVAAALCNLAYAHRDSYFKWSFPNDASLGHTSWSVKGISGGDEADANYVVYADGSLKHNGVATVAYTHDSTTGHGSRDWYSPDNVSIRFIAGSDINVNPHITPVVVVEGSNGTATYTFPTAQSSLEITQELVATAVDGDYRNLGTINSFTLYFDNVAADEILSLEKVNFYSNWVMSTVDPGKKTVVVTRDGTVEETGTTYIQAEDYDEKAINGHVAHSPAISGGSNHYRDFEVEDGPLYIGGADDRYYFYVWSADGCKYGSNGNNWAIKNCEPNGSERGKFTGTYKDATSNLITLEEAMNTFGVWFEYTFDVLTDCTADFSLCAGVHGISYGAIQVAGSDYYKKPREENGYEVEGLSEDYYSKYSFGMRLFVDGVAQRTAWSAAPRFIESEENTLAIIKDPSLWIDYQETVDGKKQNAEFMYIFPWPYGSLEEGWLPYNSWHPFFISDMIDTLVKKGDLTEKEAEPYRHADFCDVPLTKGRHTIKVQNIGGQIFFDMIRIQAKGEPSGIDGILADDPDDSAEPVYYDLNGRRVANPTGGIYVVRRGSKVSKEVIR